MSELKVIDVNKMADVRSLSGQFYRKSEVDEVISTIKAERDEYRYNLSCARNEINNIQEAMRDDIKSITNKDKEIAELEERIADGDKDFEMATSQNERLLKFVRHHKHKRCLAMAQVLEHVCPITNRKAKWQDKWHKRWLELSEKFKVAK